MKKKLIMITTLALIIVLAVAGTALAGNGNGSGEQLEAAAEERMGNSSERGTGQRFAVLSEDYETEEEFHEAVLAMKLDIIEAKVEDGSMTQEDADAIIEHLTACDGDCEVEGENPNRPEDGWGIFGTGNSDGQGMGNGNKGAGNGEKLADCDGEEVPVRDGSGNEEGNGNGYKGGNR